MFNLRDVSRIWEGILICNKEGVSTLSDLLSLWKHECLRVISDRFTNKKDVEWFEKRINALLVSDLGEEYEKRLVPDAYFVDFLRDAPEATGAEDEDLEAPKVYERVKSFDRLREKLLEYMGMYNETIRGAKMDLVFFKDCMIHMIRVSRIIRTPQGNALLVGVGGESGFR